MSRALFPRFTHWTALREIHRAHLHPIVLPHAEYLAAHGVALPADPAALDYERLGLFLLDLPYDAPPLLVDGLYHVHEMATQEGAEALIDAAAAAGIELSTVHGLAPADIAAQIWVANPELLRGQHAQATIERRKTFDSYLPRPGPRPPLANLDTSVPALERAAEAWYAERQKGRGTKVFASETEHEVRLIVRHGGLYKREGSLDDGEPSSVHYRPMAFSVAVYDRRTGELRLNAKGKREKAMYRERVGYCLFGDRDFFLDKTPKYTLEPLRRDGRECLRCADVPGIRRVLLREVTMYLGGAYEHRRTESAAEVYLALEERGEFLPADALPTAAKFEFTFADSTKPRPVKVYHGNSAQYTRDGDADLVEQWLRQRQFILQGARHAAVAHA